MTQKNMTFNYLLIIFLLLSCQRTQEIKSDTEKNIFCNELDSEMNLYINFLEKSNLVSFEKSNNKIIKYNNHSVFIKMKKKKLIDKFPSGNIIYSTFYCADTEVLNQFQIICFDSTESANNIFNILESKINTSSYFEKPYKFFFLKDNKIFYFTSDLDITCSSSIIEYFAKNYFNYNVKYSYLKYKSGKKRL